MTAHRAANCSVSSEEVLSFWFGDAIENETEALARAKRWFAGDRALDDEIHARFLTTIEAALAGKLDAWASTIRGRLALVIVLDQFTRNAFRGYAKAWHGDARALALCLEALDQGLDQELTWIERSFLALPLHHAENPALCARALDLAKSELLLAPPELVRLAETRVEQAEKYEEILGRFGRFPFRNAGLGRRATPEERSFLNDFVALPRLVRSAA